MPSNEWVTLLEIFDRLQAEIIKEALEAQGIPVQLFQEGASHYIYPVSGPMGKIELCVPGEQQQEAQLWLAAYTQGDLVENFDEQPEQPDEPEQK